MAEKGRTWNDEETRVFIEIWSEDSIQRKLQGTARNSIVLKKLVEEMGKRGYFRTVIQIRTKLKSLKKKYKEIADKLRRSGAGRESEDEPEACDFPFFKEIDLVMGGKATVAPVHILDSSSSDCSRSTTPVISDSSSTTPVILDSSSTTPVILDSSFTTPVILDSSFDFTIPAISGSSSTTPAISGSSSTTPAISGSSSTTPAISGSSSTTPAISGSSSTTPAISGSSSTPTISGSQMSDSDDEETIPKKKRRRQTKMQKAEQASRSMLKDLLEVQGKERRRSEVMEKKRMAAEDKREEREAERSRQLMGAMTQMMTTMSQYMGAAMYTPPASFPMGIMPPCPPYFPTTPHTPSLETDSDSD